MLPRRSRLPREEFRSGRFTAASTAYFSLKARKNAGKYNRIGVIVNTAVDKRATKRNTLKRQAKGALHALPDAGYDFLAIMFRKAGALEKNELSALLRETAERLTRKLQ